MLQDPQDRKSTSSRSGVAPPPTTPASGFPGSYPLRTKPGRSEVETDSRVRQRPFTPPSMARAGPMLPGGETPDSWKSPDSRMDRSLPGSTGTQDMKPSGYPDPISSQPSQDSGRGDTSVGIDGILPKPEIDKKVPAYVPSAVSGRVVSGQQSVYKQPLIVENATEAPSLEGVLKLGNSVETTQETQWASRTSSSPSPLY